MDEWRSLMLMCNLLSSFHLFRFRTLFKWKNWFNIFSGICFLLFLSISLRSCFCVCQRRMKMFRASTSKDIKMCIHQYHRMFFFCTKKKAYRQLISIFISIHSRKCTNVKRIFHKHIHAHTHTQQLCSSLGCALSTWQEQQQPSNASLKIFIRSFRFHFLFNRSLPFFHSHSLPLCLSASFSLNNWKASKKKATNKKWACE